MEFNFLHGPADIFGFVVILFSLVLIFAQAYEQNNTWGIGFLFLSPVLIPVFIITNWKMANAWVFGTMIGALVIWFF